VLRGAEAPRRLVLLRSLLAETPPERTVSRYMRQHRHRPDHCTCGSLSGPWVVPQLREAFPFDEAGGSSRYPVFDRDTIFSCAGAARCVPLGNGPRWVPFGHPNYAARHSLRRRTVVSTPARQGGTHARSAWPVALGTRDNRHSGVTEARHDESHRDRRTAMLNGVMFLWFLLTALSVAFVAIDIRSTPESPVLKWAFILITVYTGPLGAFLYVLGCREPLPGLHERYTAAPWRQTLGSTMHCVAGDGAGIIIGAALGSVWHLPAVAHLALEYALGFALGWTIFQALFMRSMSRSYGRALASTFIPEWLSMNALMGGMIAVMAIAMRYVPQAGDPSQPAFWFAMSMSLTAGFAVAYPVNAWLVSRHLKHGMMTVRHPEPPRTVEYARHEEGARSHRTNDATAASISPMAIAGMSAATILLLATGLVIMAFVPAM
jgi:hypothetical protein